MHEYRGVRISFGRIPALAEVDAVEPENNSGADQEAQKRAPTISKKSSFAKVQIRT
jgi:hypothetical protein